MAKWSEFLFECRYERLKISDGSMVNTRSNKECWTAWDLVGVSTSWKKIRLSNVKTHFTSKEDTWAKTVISSWSAHPALKTPSNKNLTFLSWIFCRRWSDVAYAQHYGSTAGKVWVWQLCDPNWGWKNNLFIICSIGAEEFSARRSGLKVSNTAFSHFSVVVPKSGLAEMETKARHSVVCSFWRSNLYQEVDRA